MKSGLTTCLLLLLALGVANTALLSSLASNGHQQAAAIDWISLKDKLVDAGFAEVSIISYPLTLITSNPPYYTLKGAEIWAVNDAFVNTKGLPHSLSIRAQNFNVNSLTGNILSASNPSASLLITKVGIVYVLGIYSPQRLPDQVASMIFQTVAAYNVLSNGN